jgi:putative ABC transport system substrate-binding protein
MKRRQFITLLGGATVAWPLGARAQQPERVRRVGVLMNLTEGDPEGQRNITAFEQALRARGWTGNRSLQIHYRWTGGDTDRIRQLAAELVALAPDVILTSGGTQIRPLQQLTSSIPIVFVQTSDPVGAGFVASLSRPGGNTTGFAVFEYGIGGKWLGLLKQIAPRLTRVAVLRDPTNPSGTGLFGAISTAAPSFGVEAVPVGLHDAGEIERGIGGFARGPGDGLIVTPSTLAVINRELIVAQAARHRIAAVYPFRFFVTAGGLLYYGPDVIDQFRNAAGYVDRILNGEQVADLPVQTPTKYEFAINLKTAKALGLDVPPGLLAGADEVIE